MNPSRRFLAVLAALFATAGVGLALPAQAVHPLVVLEDSLELTAGASVWSDDLGGAFQIPNCIGCTKRQYPVSRNAVFRVGSREVSYAEFLVAVRAGRDRALFVHISKATGEVAHAEVFP